jgi:nucleoside-diphosphate-sugar epimerase
MPLNLRFVFIEIVGDIRIFRPLNATSMKNRILVIGACGQIGTELTARLRQLNPADHIIASDIRSGGDELMNSGPFEVLDATNYSELEDVVINYEISEVYQMAALLSATAEKFPIRAWDLNMSTLFNVLRLAKEDKIEKLFWPSSIAVFGPSTPKVNTPQLTIAEPTTVYGISKLAGERWCEYYHQKFGVDVRSIRYPGLVGYNTLPGGGTTDYAVDIFYKAIEQKSFTSFLDKDARLPMMYIDDAINATVSIMQADARQIKIRSSYNLAAMSFSPMEIAAEIKKHIPEFKISYEPDFRQEIAESWPESIDDSHAREDWGWEHHYELEELTRTMLEHLG